MLTAGLVLLLVSAVFHATAQAMIKESRDKQSFSWLMLGAAAIGGAPLLFTLGQVEPAAWIFIAVSGALEALYYAVLAKAYSLGDFSVVYPVSRGSAPLFVLLWAAVFLGERPSAAGVLGILLVVFGIYFVNLPSLSDWRRPFSKDGFSAAPWALATGLVISLYTTVDKAGMRYFDPAIYLYLVFVVAWLLLAPAFLLTGKRTLVIEELTRPKEGGGRVLDVRACGLVVFCALLVFAAYCLVLAALKLSPASYVAPTREISVVIAAWIGVRRFGERGGRLRLVSAALVVAGVVVIALAK
jgi:drug/metabolite transporter (DMT)-like permease